MKGEFTLDTYNTVFQDPVFWNSLWITIKINIVMIPLQIVISFILAMMVNLTVRGIAIFRTIFYLPFTISLTVATILWNMMFNANNGILNSFLSVFGIPAQKFLLSSSQALWCIVIIASWKGCGYWMMFILAGLKNIDTSIYESAKMDGAGFFTTVFKITIPLIKRVLLFVCVANTTANVLLFVPMQLLTNGGPEGSTNVLMYEAYQSAFSYGNRSRSAVMVTVLLILIILICLVQFKFLNEKEEGRA
ncbi:carbohydrate ABC transporter permease [Massiliimalia massiliensis]|uniref:carbohydrate ABC transporter permease n=1 Tax=Massiliimalia massiliensis TaxID=1852384 RepID=UPI001E5B5628|nr:sugar ABC transporter permease [Massiliimalia massiliensis]